MAASVNKWQPKWILAEYLCYIKQFMQLVLISNGLTDPVKSEQKEMRRMVNVSHFIINPVRCMRYLSHTFLFMRIGNVRMLGDKQWTEERFSFA